MGKRGPKPTAKATLKLRGSWRAKKRSDPAYPSSTAPLCPNWLQGEGLVEWERQVEILGKKKLLSADYQMALAMWCESWGEYVECVLELRKTGLTTTTDKGNLIQHPLVSIRNKAFERATKIGQQFGFSPTTCGDVPKQEGESSKPAGLSAFSRQRA